jgi:peptidoglycan/xylan/chitin deacetylase (PgdA/CDA1 family)
MTKNYLIFFLLLFCLRSVGQDFNVQQERVSHDYQTAKWKVADQLRTNKPGLFGEFIPDIEQKLTARGKMVALTFDACGGPNGSGVDRAILDFLKKEKIPATLFISGSWLEKNLALFKQLCKEPLFEIENHGLTHRPFAIAGETKYKIRGTQNFSEAYDEVELNARQIQFYAHRRPLFYRPATVAADQGAVAIARQLKMILVGYSVLSNDALAGSSTDLIRKSILDKIKPGAIVIMHMNHPERNGLSALRLVVPVLRSQGYQFVKLENNLAGK